MVAGAVEDDDLDSWFYKDPQGTLQGPFSSQEMAEWFGAGYFTMNLLVRRGRSAAFQVIISPVLLAITNAFISQSHVCVSSSLWAR